MTNLNSKKIGLLSTMAFLVAFSATAANAAPPPDADNDTVQDKDDKCPGTPAGAKVDANGCSEEQNKAKAAAADDDGDKVPNAKDKCPGTKAGANVNLDGCSDEQLKAAATTKPADDKKPAKKTGGNTGGRKTVPKVDCSGLTIPHANLALVSGEPVWKGRFDGDMPPPDLKCPAERPFAAAIGSVAAVSKGSQQCYEFRRSESMTLADAWKEIGGVPAHAANVTPNIGQPRMWCVKSTINPADFDNLAKFLDLLEKQNWEDLNRLLQDAPNLARMQEVQDMLAKNKDELMDEINKIRSALTVVTRRVEVLEKDMKEVKADVADLKKRRFSLDLGLAGYISPPMLGGQNMAYEALAKIALNFVFGQDGNWIFRPALGVGAGYDRVWGVALTFEASFLKVLNSGSINLGPMVRGSTNILLTGPRGSYASDSNAGGGALARFYFGQSKAFYLEASAAIGGKIQNCPRGGYCANLGGDAMVGFGGTIR